MLKENIVLTLVLLITSLIHSESRADVPKNQSSQEQKPISSEEKEIPSLHQTRLSLQDVAYPVSPRADWQGMAQVPQATFSQYSQFKGKHLDAGLDFDAALVFPDPRYHSYLNAREGYYGLKFEAQGFYLGRKKEKWSGLDDEWKLGLYQPRFRYDLLAPDTVGLTGLFYEIRTKGFELSLMGSGIYVPESGPPIRIDGNGNLLSPSPQFSAPGQNVDLFGQAVPIRYDLQMPPLTQILLQPSFSAQVAYRPFSRLKVSASYANKPMNQILLSYDGMLLLDKQYSVVTIVPKVIRHQILAADLTFEEEVFQARVGGLAEIPANQPDAVLTQQSFSQATTVDSILGVKLFGRGERALQLGAGYLRTFGGNSSDQGPLANPGLSVFESHYQFQSAAQFKAKKVWSYFTGESRVLYDTKSQAMLISPKATFHTERNWRASVGFDLIGIDDNSSSQMGQSFDYFRRVQGLDRVTGALSYVF